MTDTDYSAEEWRSVAGYEGLYDVSDFGRVRCALIRRTTHAGRLLRPGRMPRGYRYVNLHRDGKSRTFLVHRLVAAAFLGPCAEGHEVNHRDGRKDNNHLGNLEYLTHSANQLHASETGLMARGDRHPQAKLTAEDAKEIREMLRSGRAGSEIAEERGVSRATITNIRKRKVWKHVA